MKKSCLSGFIVFAVISVACIALSIPLDSFIVRLFKTPEANGPFAFMGAFLALVAGFLVFLYRWKPAAKAWGIAKDTGNRTYVLGGGLIVLLISFIFGTGLSGNSILSTRSTSIAQVNAQATEAARPTPTPTMTATQTPLPTNTPLPSRTPIPTNTPLPSRTPIPSSTSTPTQIHTETYTSAPTETQPQPTLSVTIPPIEAAACVPGDAEPVSAKVVNVTDGDTIDVEINGQVFPLRYIGIDAPEDTQNVQPGGPEATAKNKELVEGKTVVLVKDLSEKDRFDRLLRYVFVDNIFVNYELVRLGVAVPITYEPDVSCDETFRAAVPVSPTEEGTAAPEVVITRLFYNGTKGNKEPDEFVEIENKGSQPVQLEGWTLRDNQTHVFYFPDFELEPGQTCRIYTNEDHPESCGFSFNEGRSAVWNNGGDCAYLIDDNGIEIEKHCY